MATIQLPDIRKKTADADIGLYVGIGIVGVGILVFTALNFLPLFTPAANSPDSKQVQMPAGLDYTGWRALAAQHRGRCKPFETAAIELMREITGRSKLQGQDPVPILVMWLLEIDPKAFRPESKWDQVPFILCEHHGLRNLVYRMEEDGQLSKESLSYAQEHGKFISPADLRAFRVKYERVREENKPRFRELNSSLGEQIMPALHRLKLFESLGQSHTAGARDKANDPLAFVALDKVGGAPWLSLEELRQIADEETGDDAWHEIMKDRVKNVPHLYLTAQANEALVEFQKRVKAGAGAEEVDRLVPILEKRQTEKTQEFLRLRQKGEKAEADKLVVTVFHSLPRSEKDELGEFEPALERIGMLFMQEKQDQSNQSEKIAVELAALLKLRDVRALADLRERLPLSSANYDPEDAKFRMLHLTYLETRFPELYADAMKWQATPRGKARDVLNAFNALGHAYRSGNAEQFAAASQAFFDKVRDISQEVGAYPGSDSISDRLGALLSGDQVQPPSAELLTLEQTFNRVKPFQWAWVLMLLSLLMFCLSLGLDSKWCYRTGFGLFAGSLALQVFGFFTRIVISGRPPVTTMYETVIWVAFMSSVFALILECVYRKKVIAIAGALVATVGLVLADQLPLALDPKISPLVPVLRSNFWLAIHVLTIVSSYAGGTLAWGLANISLILIVFGSAARRDTIKVLSNFIYRALQIAVLLLAAGTFLGGWWAAFSWGRFWGWDAKENGALIALVVYVIPLHMRYVGWIKDFGLAIAAILCYAAILASWYGVNFIWPAGLHAYGFGSGGASWVYWACLINVEWVLVAALIYRRKLRAPEPDEPLAVA